MQTVILDFFTKRDIEYLTGLIRDELKEAGINPSSFTFHIEVQIESGEEVENDDKQELVDRVIQEMKRDIACNDWTAIDALLYNVESKSLQQFLPEGGDNESA